MRKIALLIVLFFSLLSIRSLEANPVQAQYGITGPPSIYSGTFANPNASNRYTLEGLQNTLLPGIATWIAGFLGAIAVLFLIWAGIQFLTAEGDPEKISKAAKTAFYVLAGVLLVMFAYAIVYLFVNIFSP